MRGTSRDAAVCNSADGSMTSPVCSGVMPSAPCRYWKISSQAPDNARMHSIIAATDTLNAG